MLFPYQILMPHQESFTGEASMVVVPGVEGVLGIMAYHENFASLLLPGIVKIYVSETITLQIFIDGGILTFADNQLNILVEDAIDLATITSLDASQRYEKALADYRQDHLKSSTKIAKEYQVAKALLEATHEKI